MHQQTFSYKEVLQHGISKSWKLILFSPFWIAWIEFKNSFLCYCVSTCPSSFHFFPWGGFDYVDLIYLIILTQIIYCVLSHAVLADTHACTLYNVHV
jgi:hypothetical protein